MTRRTGAPAAATMPQPGMAVSVQAGQGSSPDLRPPACGHQPAEAAGAFRERIKFADWRGFILRECSYYLRQVSVQQRLHCDAYRQG